VNEKRHTLTTPLLTSGVNVPSYLQVHRNAFWLLSLPVAYSAVLSNLFFRDRNVRSADISRSVNNGQDLPPTLRCRDMLKDPLPCQGNRFHAAFSADLLQALDSQRLQWY